ncbi:MAG: hypothetical protein NC937_02515, partial [Candidatus Omnitrophica bacterium]|nr:hypothetical protein [Candidatus Omnitrophota bacterium]
ASAAVSVFFAISCLFFNIILPFCMAFVENKDSEIIKFLDTIFSTHPALSENSTIKAFKAISGESNRSELICSTSAYFGAHFYMRL